MFKHFILVVILVFSIATIGISQILGKDSLDSKSLKVDIKYQILEINSTSSMLDFNTEYYKHKAFFCRMEDLMYNKTGKNLRFRLGNLDYVNILESK